MNVSYMYRKISKICPGAFIFQTPCFKGLTYGGAYIRRAYTQWVIYVTTSIELAYSWKANKKICAIVPLFAFFYFAHFLP